MPLSLQQVEIASLSGQPLLNISNAEFTPGICALTGKNGAGKSTLLKALAAVHKVTTGDILLDGVSLLNKPKAYLSKTCYMPQNFAAYPQLTGTEFVQYLLSLHGAKRREAKKMAEFWLTGVGLEHAMHTPCGTYSQGMLQKLGFAFSIAVNKPLTIMDEPFAGVDPEGRALLLDMLFDPQFQQRIFIVCTHHVDEMQDRHAHVKKIVNGDLLTDGSIL